MQRRPIVFFAVFASLLLSGLALAPQAEAKPFRHRFNEWRAYNQHWLSVCPIDAADKGGVYGSHCWATTFAGEKYQFARRHQLAVYRHRDTGAVQIRFAIHWEDLDPSSLAILKFDGAPPVDLAVADLEQRQTQNVYWLTDPVVVEAMLADMRASNGLNLRYRFQDGREEKVRFSMIGFTKAFEFTQEFAPVDR
jgi:hypothetical protein